MLSPPSAESASHSVRSNADGSDSTVSSCSSSTPSPGLVGLAPAARSCAAMLAGVSTAPLSGEELARCVVRCGAQESLPLSGRGCGAVATGLSSDADPRDEGDMP